MTATISEIEQEILNAHEFDIICQPVYVECDRQAKWIVKSTCGCETLLCGPHCGIVRSHCASQNYEMFCKRCEENVVTEFVPIGA